MAKRQLGNRDGKFVGRFVGIELTNQAQTIFPVPAPRWLQLQLRTPLAGRHAPWSSSTNLRVTQSRLILFDYLFYSGLSFLKVFKDVCSHPIPFHSIPIRDPVYRSRKVDDKYTHKNYTIDPDSDQTLLVFRSIL